MRVCEEPHKAFGRYEKVFLTDAEYAELQNDFPDRLERFVEEMSRYLAAALRIWAADGCCTAVNAIPRKKPAFRRAGPLWGLTATLQSATVRDQPARIGKPPNNDAGTLTPWRN